MSRLIPLTQPSRVLTFVPWPSPDDVSSSLSSTVDPVFPRLTVSLKFLLGVLNTDLQPPLLHRSDWRPKNFTCQPTYLSKVGLDPFDLPLVPCLLSDIKSKVVNDFCMTYKTTVPYLRTYRRHGDGPQKGLTCQP